MNAPHGTVTGRRRDVPAARRLPAAGSRRYFVAPAEAAVSFTTLVATAIPLGRRLLVRVRDLMHAGADLPQVEESVAGTTAMLEMTAKKLGMTTVVDRAGALAGVITDGDLRRFIQRGGDFLKATAAELASRNPKSIAPDDLAAKAVEMMERYSITTLVVTDTSFFPTRGRLQIGAVPTAVTIATRFALRVRERAA